MGEDASPTIRSASEGDADMIAAIYAHHVLTGTATFDTEPPTPAVWRDKIASHARRGWPILVATQAGQLVGFAYAAQFRDRAAYAASCEDSIYIAHDRVGGGLGARLLAALIVEARSAGFEQMIAVIGGAEPASAALHAKLGFREVGRLHAVGRNFGRTLDTLYMQRSLTT